MEDINQTSLPLHCNTHLYQDCFLQSMDELRQQSLILTMELQDTKLKLQQELKARDEEISQLKQLLTRAITEKDEAQQKSQKAIFDRKLLIQHILTHSTFDDRDQNNGLTSSDCDDQSIVSSELPDHHELPVELLIDRPLPEKGKLLDAVMNAGPLLQTLMLAGPLPSWRHPPPPVDTCQIPPPPVVPRWLCHNNISSKCGMRKRGFSDQGYDHDSDGSHIELKYQRVVLQ